MYYTVLVNASDTEKKPFCVGRTRLFKAFDGRTVRARTDFKDRKY